MTGGSVGELLRHLAEHDPAGLDALAVNVAADQDDPAWSEAERQRVGEARRRLLERIAAVRG